VSADFYAAAPVFVCLRMQKKNAANAEKAPLYGAGMFAFAKIARKRKNAVDEVVTIGAALPGGRNPW
jgi:hypothetical protein